MSEQLEVRSATDPVSGDSPGRRAWRRFRDNRLAMASAVLLAVIAAFAVVYPWFSN